MRVKIERGRLIYLFDKADQDVLSISGTGQLVYTYGEDDHADYYISNEHLFYELPIMYTLITDRTQADVDLVRQLAAEGKPGMTPNELSLWLSDLKGSYNRSDLNRVGKAINYLSARLELEGYTGTAPVKTDWTDADIWITQAQLESYRQALLELRTALDISAQLPAVPKSYGQLTYQRANDIELLLYLIFQALENIAASSVYSGQVNSGIIWGEFTT